MAYTLALAFSGVLLGSNGTFDFDGNKVKIKGRPVKGALDFVNRVFEGGNKIIIFSSLAERGGGITAMRTWLKENKFPVDKFTKITAIKPTANLYVDAEAYRFEGEFSKLESFIKRNPDFKIWSDK